MGNLKSEAEQYEPQGMKNISELPSVEVEMALMKENKTRTDGTTYLAQYIVVDGEEYRVPSTVLSALKEILEEKPKLKTFKVRRKGTTKEDTRYTVIPLD